VPAASTSKLLPAYLFTGDQDLLKAEAVEKLRKAAGGGSVRSFYGGVKVGEILEARQNGSLFDPVAVIVVRQAAKLTRAEAQEIAEHLASAGEGPPIVFWDETLRKDVPLFKQVAAAGGEREFVPPRGREMESWVRDEAGRLGHRITPGAVETLVELVGNDLLRLRSTLERVSIALGPGVVIDEASLDEHVAASRLHAVYELQDAVSAKHALEAVGLFRQLVDEGGEPPAIVGALCAQVRRLLLARENPTAPNLAAFLGVAPYRASRVVELAKGFSPGLLRAALDELGDIDVASKTGRGDSVAALEAWLLALCAPERRGKEPHVARR